MYLHFFLSTKTRSPDVTLQSSKIKTSKQQLRRVKAGERSEVQVVSRDGRVKVLLGLFLFHHICKHSVYGRVMALIN